jgi:lysophospholipase L1-like esterase
VNKSKLNKRILTILLQVVWVLFATTTILIIIEVSIRYFYKEDNSFNLPKFIASKPEPFKDDLEFDILIKNFDGTCEYPPLITRNGNLFYPRDFSCAGTTYLNGKRLTLPRLDDNFKNTIHVFGGSTVWGTGSTDSKTIPSLIQAKTYHDKLRVINYGMTSIVADQEKQILLNNINAIKKGDVVIFYDGGNDFWNAVMQGNIGGTIIGFNQRNRGQLLLFEIRNWLYHNSKTYIALSDILHNRKNSMQCQTNLEEASKRLLPAAEYYANCIKIAKNTTEKKGAFFLHFLQPTLFDIQNPTLYESSLFDQNPCYSVAKNLKPKFNELFFKNAKASVDLSTTFNNKDLLWDYIHTSSKGNDLIAKEIIPYIFNTIKDRDINNL